MTIHWVGTGLSAIPGLRELLRGDQDVTVWNRTEGKARDAVGDLCDDIRAYAPEVLAQAVAPGDIVVSMLPADQHVALAEMAIDKGAHFISSSYIAPQMAALDDRAKAAGVVVMNEVGLDPGIDHLMAHDLVADFKAQAQPGDVIRFTSYCGGVPKLPNPFRYKFSWSPLGVLRALRSPSKSLRGGQVRDVARPWDAIEAYDAPLPKPESFEVYPNRDSLPFIAQYGFDPDWNVQDFVRGTLRLQGWQQAWTPVFQEVETLSGDTGEARLREMADQFWRDNSYAEGEPDRVVLFVALSAERDGQLVWNKEWVLDAFGTESGSAMAQLVSITVALAVGAVSDGRIEPGVHAAPEEPAVVGEWLEHIGAIAQHMAKLDHMN
ncbi:saccharopine dehydrogenase NADP-binding domain-containing protein [Paracoccus sp. Z330]|uniref:Saccharopine dehydrogenase NADP-binding domain-containing protein n=1 Tax=Paracoccus onchidii TaxID=3017813 RepID=A0ABT4ZHV3_9RHOB|nr:saccharopine dehydrogenase family protein [Paracoccus onchidii]MDB6178933.1 saccharopine dehydrogenase NADP-binding domain-containing protein [Paracoccus onchidii]